MRTFFLVLFAVLACSSLVNGKESKLHKIAHEFKEKVKHKEHEIIEGIKDGIKNFKNKIEKGFTEAEQEIGKLYKIAEKRLVKYNLTALCDYDAKKALAEAQNSTADEACSKAPEDAGKLILAMSEHSLSVAADVTSIVNYVSTCVALGPAGGVVCMLKNVYDAYETILKLYEDAKELVLESIRDASVLTTDFKACFKREKPKVLTLIKNILIKAKKCKA